MSSLLLPRPCSRGSATPRARGPGPCDLRNPPARLVTRPSSNPSYHVSPYSLPRRAASLRPCNSSPPSGALLPPMHAVHHVAAALGDPGSMGTQGALSASRAVYDGTGTTDALSQLVLNQHVLVSADIGSALYGVSQTADAWVAQSLTTVSPATCGVILLAGLLTSLSPCTLSVLPLTIGYIGGYSSAEDTSNDGSTPPPLIARSLAFATGLATTLALLGVVSTSVGRAYGEIGDGLPIAVSVVAIVMGLNLLEVVTLSLPSIDVDTRQLSLPPLGQAYAAGLTFALAASPCSTPVLATLLAYVAQAEDPAQGALLLLCYTFGYVAPLLVAASATSKLTQIMALRGSVAWVTPASGVLLLAGGTFTLLNRLV